MEMNFDFELDDYSVGSTAYFQALRSERPELETNVLNLKLANVENNENFVTGLKTEGKHKQLTDFAKGTTTLAFVYQGGIVVSVDARATMGNYISSGNVSKVQCLTEYCLATMAGGAADCWYWERRLATWMKLFELRHNKRPTIRAASAVFQSYTKQYKGYGLQIGAMIMGFDHGEPVLFYCNHEGMKIENHIFSNGSGSVYAYGILDSKYRWNMAKEEAIELGREAIYQATHRDTMSGGRNNIYHFTNEGYVKVQDRKDVNELHYEYAHKRGLRGDGNEVPMNVFDP